MADIILTLLFEQKKREFRTQGQGSDRFRADFLEAVNRSGRRINVDADLATRITQVNSVEGTVALDEAYEHVLSNLVTINLIHMGQKPSPGTDIDYQQLVRQLPEQIDSIRQDKINVAQEADTDDETDFIGLGALGG